MNMEPSGCTVVGEMMAEVCLSNKRRKVIPSSGVVLLPDEIITEVLLRLPIKSILRFRAVCRSWAALLSSEEFCSLHMAMAEVKPSPPKLLFVSPTENFDSTAVYSCSLLDHRDDLLFTLDYARGNFVDVVPAPCHGLTLIYDAVVPAYYVLATDLRLDSARDVVRERPALRATSCANARPPRSPHDSARRNSIAPVIQAD
jgi:hypothetical protein